MGSKGGSDFDQIFDRYFEQVYSYVAYRVAGDSQAAEDITQEVFLAALKALPDFRGDGSALTWLRSIVRNKVADHFRIQGSFEPRPTDQKLAEVESHGSEQQEQAVLVSLAIRQLPEGYAELLEEKYLERLSVKEIARRKKMTEKAVESALSRAREAFRRIFQRLEARRELTK